MSEHLHHKLAVLRQNLLQGKLPRSVRWDEALERVEHLVRVEAHGGEEFAFVVGAHRELFKRPHGQDLGIDEVSRLRRFLKTAGAEGAAAEHAAESTTVVVIDHHSAHLYRDANAGSGQQDVEIKPYDPHHFHHHLVHRKEAHYQGDRVPEETSFYEEIAQALVPARDVVLVGHGVGKSSAVDALLSHLKAHHPELAQRVKAVEVLDLSALSEPQIEAIVRRKMGTAS
jgi:phosphoglycolate phosphatase-like HAD superfamily hydrolase